MPELPEVETVKNDLKKYLLNKRISAIELPLKRIVKSDLDQFNKLLLGNYFIDIIRVAKLLIFELKNHPDDILLVHLRMTGQLIYSSPLTQIAGGHSDNDQPSFEETRFTRAIFHFEDNSKLYFNDMRTFGVLKLIKREELPIILNRFGIEPLQKNFTLKNFKKVFSNRNTNIKAILLNQELISGIGNIYADEILFRAGLRPDRIAKTLSDIELDKLWRSSNVIIKKAIKERGTTFNNYRDGRGKKGNFIKFLKVYGRGGEKCYNCNNILIKKRIAGRGTVFCSSCQK